MAVDPELGRAQRAESVVGRRDHHPAEIAAVCGIGGAAVFRTLLFRRHLRRGCVMRHDDQAGTPRGLRISAFRNATDLKCSVRA